MSYQTKIENVCSIITEHNSVDGASPYHTFKKIDVNGFLVSLKTLGAVSEETLAEATWEDIEECGLPRLLARKVAKVFRSDFQDEQDNKQFVIVDDDPVKLAAKLKPLELVEKYDPENPNDPYGERLKGISEGRRFIVFGQDGKTLVDKTKELLDELLNYYPEREYININDVPTEIYKVGDKPAKYVDEDPFNPGTPLRTDGTSDSGCDWSDFAIEVRQLIAIAVSKNENHIRSKSEFDILNLLLLNSEDSFKVFSLRYPQSAIIFTELKRLNQLPQLKIRLGSKSGRKSNNPWSENAIS